MKRYLMLPAAIFLICFEIAHAQTFEFAGSNPFNIQLMDPEDASRLALKYFFIDADGDGDFDLVLFGLDEPDTSSLTTIGQLRYFFEYQENIGDARNPQFGLRQKLYEGFNFPGVLGFALPSIGHINGDKKFDILMSAEVDENFLQHPLIFLQDSNNLFEKHRCEEWQLDPLTPFSLFFPELIDLDLDGDQDLLLSGYYAENYQGEGNTNVILYAKNIGTPTSPDFLGWFENPYGLQAQKDPFLLRGGDLDLDNDMDLLAMSLSGEEEVNFFYYKNEPGADGKPHYSDPIALPEGFPESQREGDAYFFPNIVDIDGDQDLDIFFYHQQSTDDTTIVTLDLYENKLCSTQEVVQEVTICEGESIEGYAETGSYRDRYLDSRGCDSVRVLNLTVISSIETNVSEIICEGASYDGYTEAGNYTDVFQASNGCDSTRILALRVVPNVETFVEMDLCSGESINIGGEEISTSGSYIINLKNSNGCDSIIYAEVKVHSIDTTITVEGNVLTANAGAEASYQWYDCTTSEDIIGAIASSYQATTSGEYGVHIMDAFGCIMDSECITVIATNVHDKVLRHIELFPNPANELVFIQNKSGYPVYEAQIFDTEGKLVLMGNDPSRINVKNLHPGIYFISLKLDGIDYPMIRKISIIR